MMESNDDRQDQEEQRNVGAFEGQRTKNRAVGVLSALVALILGALIASGVIYWPARAIPVFDSGVPEPLACALTELPGQACLGTAAPLCPADMKIARTAWKFFENNYQEKTGLVNSADRYPSTTMWDTGSALAATVAAHELGIIDQKTFDDRVVAMMATLTAIDLFNGEAPNKAYSTETGEMVDYNNKPSPDGIGVSTLDLARLVSWLQLLSCRHPKHAHAAEEIILRWNYCRLIKNGQMYGLMRDPATQEIKVVQEGRLGYEQYAGKVFRMLGFDQSVAATYRNEFATELDIYGVPISYDVRDPRKLGAYNYVVTESYAMDVMEHGRDEENSPLIDNIFEVQKRRWRNTGITTAVSEDNVDRDPWFVYNTIFVAGSPWNAITDTGKDMEHMKSLSTKAALTMSFLYPDDEYGNVLYDAVKNAYDPERGWYSGIYENGMGYNKAITANTNGVILSGILSKTYGPLLQICSRCNKPFFERPDIIDAAKIKGKCLPVQPDCQTCGG
ncbi:MAG: DUF3131 domain-containing protein [Pseudomonadota bacterium]|nr:DUF3131 domain-containing protein [Pseudomonadota bacterium]